MFNKKHIIAFVVGLGISSLSFGMKRTRENNELIVHSNKRRCWSKEIVYQSIKRCDFKEFEKQINLGANVNHKYHHEPIVFLICDKIDHFREDNLVQEKARRSRKDNLQFVYNVIVQELELNNHYDTHTIRQKAQQQLKRVNQDIWNFIRPHLLEQLNTMSIEEQLIYKENIMSSLDLTGELFKDVFSNIIEQNDQEDIQGKISQQLDWIIANDPIIEEINDQLMQNNEKIKELYKCFFLLLQQKKFDSAAMNQGGQSITERIIERLFDPLYSEDAERLLPSEDEHLVLQSLLQTNVSPSVLYEEVLSIVAESTQDMNLLSAPRVLKTVETLIQHGANVYKAADDGNTLLHVCSNDLRMINLLISNGIQHDYKNSQGQTMADLSENPRVLQIIHNQEEVEACKNLIEKIMRLQTLSKRGSHSLLFLNIAREMGKVTVQPDVCPYTQAVLQHTQGITTEQMMREMGYSLTIEDSEYSYSDESSDDIEG